MIFKTRPYRGSSPLRSPCDPGGPPFKCRFNGTLQPKELKTLSLDLKFDAPADLKSVKNCATVTQPQAAPGGAGQGQGQQQKQIAPGKKSDLFPFGRSSLLRFAAFRPQSFAPSTKLLHLTGGAGGNIGGVGPNNCLKWEWTRADFVSCKATAQPSGSDTLRSDRTAPPRAPRRLSPMTARLPVRWKARLLARTSTYWLRGIGGVRTGHYVGEISPSGEFTGTNAASNGVRATFKSDRAWFQCALDDLCKKYADDAIAAETEFASLHCGAVGSGRWSDKPDEHIKWCVAQTRGGGSPIPVETEARAKELDACREFDAECTKAGLAIAAKNDEMKALNCKDAIASLQPDKAKAACKAAAIKFSPDLSVQAAQQKLDACKVAKLNGDGGAGGTADPGGGGGAGDPGAGGAADGQGGGGQVQLPANQCVDVALDDKAPDQQQAGGLALSKESHCRQVYGDRRRLRFRCHDLQS